jgi:PhoPQ-activated pathogenicity-related protein
MHATLFLSLVALAAAADWPLGPNARIGRTRTPLDDYVNKPDDHFSYYLYNTSKGVGFTAYTINMTSQKWLTENDVDRPVWWHWVVIMVPDELVHTEKSFVYITGNGNGGAPDLKSEDNLLASELAVTTKSVATALFEIPNEPLHFVQEPGQPRRSEDGIIAYTWKHFIDDPSQPEWLLRLPMTKAVVRAMDTVQQFVEETHGFRIRNFTVAGASKRGWTTWTTGAVDARVEAIAPMVMDELNFVKNLHHHYRAYGGWTFAFEDYYSLNFTAEIDNPNVELMDAIVNPSAYVDRLTMPKYIICSGGDEFFLPDDSHYYWDTLLGEKFIRIIPNAEHSLATRVVSVFTGLQGFYYTVLTGAKRPSIQWKYDDVNGVISVTTDVKPKGGLFSFVF